VGLKFVSNFSVKFNVDICQGDQIGLIVRLLDDWAAFWKITKVDIVLDPF
jgi:hypothetical protein